MSGREMVFMMGLPAAGKTTLAYRLFPVAHDWVHVDADAAKLLCPAYDPNNTPVVHDLSTQVSDEMFEAALGEGRGRWVIDGTGTNADKMVHKMNRARAAGFAVRLVYVKCSLETSLARAAKRTRRVPPTVIREKATLIQTSFELVAPYADRVDVWHND